MGLGYNVVVKAWGLGQHGTKVAFGCQGIGLGQLVNAWDYGSVLISRHGTRVACSCPGMGLG